MRKEEINIDKWKVKRERERGREGERERNKVRDLWIDREEVCE
jgi:hypothetical protein